jgi:transmembrane sensor
MPRPASPDRPLDAPDTERRQAGKDAAVFIVLLAETPDDEALKAHIEAWCAASPVNREVWARTRRTYHMIGGSPARHESAWRPEDVTASVARGRPPAAPVPVRRASARRWRWPVAIGAVGLAAAIAAVAVPPMMVRLQADEMTATAEVRSLTLADGSRMILAPRSAIALDDTPGQRGVRLLQGEAYFEVTPDAARPFRVLSGDVVTTVLGTEFEVARQDGATAVTVKGGRVRVEDASASPPVSAQLSDGDWLRVSARGVPEQRRREPGDVASWTSGLFVARNLPIGEIVDRLRAYYGGTIVVADDAFADRLVNGAYDLRLPEATLRNLAAAHDATVRKVSPWVLVVTAR